MLIHEMHKAGSQTASGTCPVLYAAPSSYVEFGRAMFLAEEAGTLSIIVLRITCLQTSVLSYSVLKNEV